MKVNLMTQESILLAIHNISNLGVIKHGSSDQVRGRRRVELDFPSIDHILDLVLQRQTIIYVMSETVGMVRAPRIGFIARSGGVRILRRVPQSNQICLQQML